MRKIADYEHTNLNPLSQIITAMSIESIKTKIKQN